MAIIPRSPNSGLMRYNTKEELRAAYEGGRISSQEALFQGQLMRELQRHQREAKSKAEQGTKKKLSDSVPQ